MDNRELTELCAKSIGCDKLGSWNEKSQCLWDGECWSFAPLDNNNDAFSLAVRRKIKIEQDEERALSIATYHKDGWNATEPHNSDPEKATRRAIVVAVAHQYLTEIEFSKDLDSK